MALSIADGKICTTTNTCKTTTSCCGKVSIKNDGVTPSVGTVCIPVKTLKGGALTGIEIGTGVVSGTNVSASGAGFAVAACAAKAAGASTLAVSAAAAATAVYMM